MRSLLPLLIFSACRSTTVAEPAAATAEVTGSGLRRVNIVVDKIE